MNIPFQIVEEKEFQEKFDHVARTFQRAYELKSSIDWVLANAAPFFPRVPGAPLGFHVLRTSNTAGFVFSEIPVLDVVYFFDGTKGIVHLLDFKVVETEENE